MHVNRTNTRADRWMVTDVELRGDGYPVIYNGRCVKTIEYTTTMCPECVDENGDRTIAAWIDDHGDSICPECGMVCGGFTKAIWPEDGSFSTRGGFEGIPVPALNDAAPRYDTTMSYAQDTSATGGEN